MDSKAIDIIPRQVQPTSPCFKNCLLPECGKRIFGRSDRKFCDITCRNKYNNQKKERAVQQCALPECEILFPRQGTKKFCSDQCCNIYRERLRQDPTLPITKKNPPVLFTGPKVVLLIEEIDEYRAELNRLYDLLDHVGQEQNRDILNKYKKVI